MLAWVPAKLWAKATVLTIAATMLLVGNEPASAQTCVVRVPDQEPLGQHRIVHLNSGSLIISGLQGFVYAPNDAARLNKVSGERNTGPIRLVHQLKGGMILVGGEKGLFRISQPGGSLERFPASEAIGTPFAVLPLEEGMVLIGGRGGLFQLSEKHDALVRVASSDGPFDVKWIKRLSGGVVLAGGENGIFRLGAPGGSWTKVPGDWRRKWFRSGHSDAHELPGDNVLVEGENGFFRMMAKDGPLLPVQGGISETERPSDSRFWMPARVQHADGETLAGAYGLFRISSRLDSLEPVDGGSYREIGEVRQIRPIAGVGIVVVGSKRVRYLPNGGRALVPVTGLQGHDFQFVTFLRETGPEVLLRHGGLFRLSTIGSAPTPIVNSGADVVRNITGHKRLRDRGVLLSDGNRLFYLSDDSTVLRPLPGFDSFEELSLVERPSQEPIVIGGDEGIVHKVIVDPLTSARSRLLSSHAVPQSKLPTSWAFPHACSQHALALGLLVRAKHEDIRKPQFAGIYLDPNRPDGSTLNANVEFDKAGKWTLELVSSTDPDAPAIGRTETVRVDQSVGGWLTEHWQYVAAGAAALHAVAFCAVLGFAYRNPGALSLLGDSFWGKFSLWATFALRHMSMLQQWVLNPYFREIRARTEARPFLDLPLRGDKDAAMLSQDVIDAFLKPGDRTQAMHRVWIQGAAGMGKTSLVQHMEAMYFAGGEDSLIAAARRSGWILIILPVRHYASLAADPKEAGAWVVDAVSKRLAHFGMAGAERPLLKSMFRSGRFAIVFDGMNEAERDDELRTFAREYPSVRVMVTSQSPGDLGFTTLRLPPDIRDHAERLLDLLMPEGGGKAIYRLICTSGLLAQIRSGYDLRLLTHLALTLPAGTHVEADDLPKDRMGLYRAILERARTRGGDEFDMARLTEVAWKMCESGLRELPVTEGLSKHMVETLLHDDVKVLRTVGSGLEFRHDQMRAYLAARWLKDESPTTAALTQRLEESTVFDRSSRDQREVWGFLTELMPGDEDREVVWRFAAKDPSRGFLQVAIQETAAKAGKPLTLLA